MKALVSASAFIDALSAVLTVAEAGRYADGDDGKTVTLLVRDRALQVIRACASNTVFAAVPIHGRAVPSTTPLAVPTSDIHAIRSLAEGCSWVTLQVEVGSDKMVVSAGNQHSLLAKVSVGQTFPQQPSIDSACRIRTADLQDLFSVARLVTREQFRAELQNWMLSFNSDESTSLGGDGGVFQMIERRGMREAVVPSPLLVPIHLSAHETMHRFLKLAASCGEQHVDFRDNGESTLISVGRVALCVQRHLLKPYPDPKKFIDREATTKLVVESITFRRAIAKMAQDAKAGRKQNRHHWTKIALNVPETATLTAVSESSVSASVPVIARGGDSADAGWPLTEMSTEYLTKIATTAADFGYVQLESVGATKPLVIRFSNEPAVVQRPWIRDLTLGGTRRVTMFVGVKTPRSPAAGTSSDDGNGS